MKQTSKRGCTLRITRILELSSSDAGLTALAGNESPTCFLTPLAESARVMRVSGYTAHGTYFKACSCLPDASDYCCRIQSGIAYLTMDHGPPGLASCVRSGEKVKSGVRDPDSERSSEVAVTPVKISDPVIARLR